MHANPFSIFIGIGVLMNVCRRSIALPRGRRLAFFIKSFWLSDGLRAGLTKFSRCLIAGCTKLFCHLTHPSGEFGQLLRSKQERNDDEDYNHVRPAKLRY